MSNTDIRKALYVARRRRDDGGQVVDQPDDLKPVYNAIAPDPGATYGSLLPLARGGDGDYRGRQTFFDPSLRWAMPTALRDIVKGGVDLLAGTKTGTLTPEALSTFTMASPTAGAAFAPRGALAAGAAKLAKPTEEGIIAYHGSPHSFDKFDATHIGAGEGNQAFGHGLYFAEHEPVAQGYKWSTTDLRGAPWQTSEGDELPSWIGTQLKDLKAGSPEFLKNVERLQTDFRGRLAEEHEDLKTSTQPWNVEGRIANVQNIIDGLERLKGGELKPRGSMYQVRINAAPEDFLHWDKPLHEQSPKVKDALEQLGVKPPEVAPEPKDPVIRSVVRKALKDNDGDPRGIGLIVDNDQTLYGKARDLLIKRGHDPEDLAPGEFIEREAENYLQSLHNRNAMTGEQIVRNHLPKTTYAIKGAGDQFVGTEAKTFEEALAAAGGEPKNVRTINTPDPHATAQRLREAGIPGIRYLDQGSRNAGEGSHNYVVFPGNEHLIDMLKRYARGGRVPIKPVSRHALLLARKGVHDRNGKKYVRV